MAEQQIGEINDFFSHVMVGGIALTGALKVGDRIRIKGHTTDIELDVSSMQINNNNVAEAKKGDSVGVKVPDRVRRGDAVYKVSA